MVEGLRSNNVDVIEIHSHLWNGIEDRVNIASGGWIGFRFPLRLIRAYINLIQQVKYVKFQEIDTIFIGYPGQLDVFLGWLLSVIFKKPLLWDVFMSIYLICIERRIDKKSLLGYVTVKILRIIEYMALRLPDKLIIDTEEYAEWLCNQYQISKDKFYYVPTGADDRIFYPRFVSKIHKKFIILYYGSFIPNHGVLTVIQAADLLRENHDLKFLLVGDGPQKEIAQKLTMELGLQNVVFLPWLEQSELVNIIAGSDVCLGVFGNTPQSLMTIQNKIYECIAMAKPVITGKSRTIQKAFQDGEHLILCERSNPKALADSITLLYKNEKIKNHISVRGYILFKENYSIRHIGNKLYIILQELIRK